MINLNRYIDSLSRLEDDMRPFSPAYVELDEDREVQAYCMECGECEEDGCNPIEYVKANKHLIERLEHFYAVNRLIDALVRKGTGILTANGVEIPKKENKAGEITPNWIALGRICGFCKRHLTPDCTESYGDTDCPRHEVFKAVMQVIYTLEVE